MRILVVNAGSSSLKLRLLGASDVVLDGVDLPVSRGATGDGPPTAAAADIRAAISSFRTVDAIGHRVVHGGAAFAGPVVVDDAVVTELTRLIELAPLHQPASLAALDLIGEILPGIPSVACFDTAFHANLPPAASTYALPAEWRERWGLRRHGFHGLSHAYAARRGGDLLGRGGDLRIVTCHLGAGASLAAVQGGRSMDTTMGFTPLEGLVMATRSGSVDPGLLLWLLEHAGVGSAELATVLEHRSGLLGLAGTPEMTAILAADAAGDTAASLALAVYVHRLRGGIAAMVASMGGLDALVFTGGVGENAAAIRWRTADGLGFLGVALDPDLNENVADDLDVSTAGAAVRTLVIRAREDLEIARQVREVLGA